MSYHKDNKEQQNFDLKTVKRLLSYMKEYKVALLLVVICILLSAIASAVSALFIQILIDDYIEPLLFMNRPDYSGLIKALLIVAII
ncbi:MAG: hypothetical protein ACI4SR_02980, partial [Faecalibacillus sp.]